MNGNDKKTTDQVRDIRGSVKMPEASPDLIARIMKDAEEVLAPKSWQDIVWPFGPVWKPAAVLMAATLVGVWVGLKVLPEGGNTITDEIETMMLG